nr:MAG TPA: Regulatory protein [Caudoviricetes sp.]
MTLGSRLKQLREDKKMNQAELGKILGVSNVGG